MRTGPLFSAMLATFLISGCYYRAAETVKPKEPPMEVQVRSPAGFKPAIAPDPARVAREEVQKNYEAEFRELLFPKPGKEPALGPEAMKCKGFPRTLQSIHAFDRRFGPKSPQYAHLTLIKGMVYLHSGKFSAASAIEPEVSKVSATLSNPGRSNGEKLLAENYKELLTGWREIYKHLENLKARDAGKSFPFAGADFRVVHKAADRIAANLRRRVLEHPGVIRNPDADISGLYLAAVGAVFYTWVQKENDRACALRGSEGCPPKKRENRERAVYYGKGRDLIGLFLTDSEKNSAFQKRPNGPGLSPARLQYLQWYGWLSGKVQEAKGGSHKKRVASS